MRQSAIQCAKEIKLSLGEFINITSREHSKQAVIELTREFILTSSSREINKKGMEFFYMHGLYDDLRLLIKINKGYTEQSSQNWAQMYQLLLDRLFKQYVPLDLLEQISRINTNEADLNCLQGLAKIAVYFDIRDYAQAGTQLMAQTSLCEELDDIYLHTSFTTKLYAYLFNYYLIKNELVTARKYAYRALNKHNSPNTEAQLHAYLGLSYIFDTYFQGMYHLSKALKIAKTHHLTNLIHTLEQRYIPFTCAHFNQTDGIQSTLSAQQAHLAIANGDNARAMEILRHLPEENPFVLYYMGVAAQDKQILMKSYTYFIEKESNYFFSRLPLNALQNIKA